MKSFATAVVFYVLAVAAAGLVFNKIGYSSTEANSTESVRVDHPAPTDGRLGWRPEG